LGQPGYIDAPLAAPLAATPYSRLGDAPVLLAAAGLLLGVWAFRRRQV
jgi:apolipoprotein N-acyltransferase